MAIPQAKIDNWFTYHPPQAGQPELYQTIRNHGREFANVINALVPDGEPKDEALSFIRYAVMAANQGVALNTPIPPISDHRRTAFGAASPAAAAGNYQTATTGTKAAPKPPSMQELIDSWNDGRK